MAKHRKSIRRWPKLAAGALVLSAAMGAGSLTAAQANAPVPNPTCISNQCTWDLPNMGDTYEWIPPTNATEVWIEAQSLAMPWSEANHIQARMNSTQMQLFVSFAGASARIGIGSWTFFVANSDAALPYSYDAGMVADFNQLPVISSELAFVKIRAILDQPVAADPQPVDTAAPTPQPTPEPTLAATPPAVEPTPAATAEPTSDPTLIPTPVATQSADPVVVVNVTLPSDGVAKTEPVAPTEHAEPSTPIEVQEEVAVWQTEPSKRDDSATAVVAALDLPGGGGGPAAWAGGGASTNSSEGASPPNTAGMEASSDQTNNTSAILLIAQVAAAALATVGGAVGATNLVRRIRARRVVPRFS